MLNIAFNMASQIGFEELSGKPFNEFNENSSKDRLQLTTAVIIANNPNTEFKAEWLMHDAKAHEIVQLYQAIADEIAQWTIEPETVAENNDRNKPEDGEENPKNDYPPASSTHCS